MVHYECYVCSITATCVDTEAADRAWIDHMNIHADDQDYGRYIWTVIQLPL